MCATPIKDKKETALILSGQQQLLEGSGLKYEICNGHVMFKKRAGVFYRV